MLQALWQTTLAFAPFLILGAALSGLLHVVLPADWLRTHLTGRLGVLKAVIFGIPLPLCSCGVIPAGVGLRRDGASRGASVGFLISTPQTGVDSILVSASMLGGAFAAFKVFAALVTGLVGGLLTDRLVGEDVQEAEAPLVEPMSNTTKTLAAAFEHALTVLQSIWRWLLFGIVASACLDYFVPPSVWSTVAGYGKLLTMLSALVISLPLYVCATASVPIAAALVAGGLPAGAALVFLMAGPATNVATLGAIHRALGGRTLAIYVATVVIGSLGLGYAFDSVIPSARHMSHQHSTDSILELGAGIVLLALMAYFAWSEVRGAWQARQFSRTATGEDGVLIELGLQGMTCQGCVRKLQGVLSADDRVAEAVVSLEPQRVQVRGQLARSDVQDLIRSAGYQPDD